MYQMCVIFFLHVCVWKSERTKLYTVIQSVKIFTYLSHQFHVHLSYPIYSPWSLHCQVGGSLW